MTRSPREDEPDSWHHVMNRGLARRTMFEGNQDVRYFLTWVARMVQARLIEVHAFVVMMTHFHLLIRSPRGELSRAMMRIQTEFARWFNRSRLRDGPLHRGRFRSKQVRSLAYRRILVRYIDSNPVLAGMTDDPMAFAYGSARHYAQPRGPIWLSRYWVEAEVQEVMRASNYDPRGYPVVFGQGSSQRINWIIQRRLGGAIVAQDPLDELLGAAPEQILDWMQRRARLADGTAAGISVADPISIAEALEESHDLLDGWMLTTSRKKSAARPQLHLALLVELCALTLAEAGQYVGVSKTGAARLIERHRVCSAKDPEYLARMSALAQRALERCHESGATVPGTVTVAAR